MSANVYWWPHKKGEETLGVRAPSEFKEAMERAGFGESPWCLGREHLATLRGMAAVYDYRDDGNPYQDLIDAIEKHGIVDVVMRY